MTLPLRLSPGMLIATDLDGTLVPKDSMTVPPFTARVLRDVDEAGMPVVFTTGRPLRWVEPLREHIGAHGIAIVS
ncbi:MAG: HAD family hydrolase, partial [Microbacterium gubbeenense]